MLEFIINITAGYIIGIISGIFGVGGGFIVVPALIIFSGFTIHSAISNSLFYVTITSLSGTFTHLRNKNIVIPVAVWCTIFAVFSAQAGVYILNNISGKKLIFIFSLLLFLVSINFFRESLAIKTREPEEDTTATDTILTPVKTFYSSFTGFLSGVASGLFGIGGGTIMVPLYSILLKMPMKPAVGTSTLVIFFTGLSGSVTHYVNGELLIREILPLALSGTIGIQAGIKILKRLSEKKLKFSFGLLMLFISIYLLFR